MTDPTPTATIEPVWLVRATCAPDAAETRVPFRPRHLARLAELKAAGVIVEAGAFLDVSESVLLIRVWVELRAKAFGRMRTADEG